MDLRSLIWSATPTPMLEDGSLDDAGLEHLVLQHAKFGVRGLFLGGTCGEGPMLPDDQRTRLVEKIRKLSGPDTHLAVQVSDTSAARVHVNIAKAVDAGADSVVIAAPWLRAFVNREFARRYFLEPLNRPCPVPIGIYVLRQPPETGIDLDLWREIAAHPQVAYIKDSSGLEDYRLAFAELKRMRPSLVLRTGDEFDVLSAIRAGYDGCLLGTAVLNAGLIGRAVAALQRRDDTDAAAWQDRSNRFLRDLFRPDISAWMSGLKYALCRLGIFSSEFSHMAYPLDDEDRRRIDAALQREREFI